MAKKKGKKVEKVEVSESDRKAAIRSEMSLNMGKKQAAKEEVLAGRPDPRRVKG